MNTVSYPFFFNTPFINSAFSGLLDESKFLFNKTFFALPGLTFDRPVDVTLRALFMNGALNFLFTNQLLKRKRQ